MSDKLTHPDLRAMVDIVAQLEREVIELRAQNSTLVRVSQEYVDELALVKQKALVTFDDAVFQAARANDAEKRLAQYESALAGLPKVEGEIVVHEEFLHVFDQSNALQPVLKVYAHGGRKAAPFAALLTLARQGKP